jgi:hypothetical protein
VYIHIFPVPNQTDAGHRIDRRPVDGSIAFDEEGRSSASSGAYNTQHSLSLNLTVRGTRGGGDDGDGDDDDDDDDNDDDDGAQAEDSLNFTAQASPFTEIRQVCAVPESIS